MPRFAVFGAWEEDMEPERPFKQSKMKTEKLDKAIAVKEISSLVRDCPNVIAFGFYKGGKTAMITATDDAIYDRLGLAIAKMLQQLGREIEEEASKYE